MSTETVAKQLNEQMTDNAAYMAIATLVQVQRQTHNAENTVENERVLILQATNKLVEAVLDMIHAQGVDLNPVFDLLYNHEKAVVPDSMLDRALQQAPTGGIQ